MNPIALPLILYVVLPITAFIAVVLLRRNHRPPRARGDREALRSELRAVLRAVPPRPVLLTQALASAASLTVEARLLAGRPRQALAEAEQGLVSEDDEPGSFIALSKALLYCDMPEEARAALRWAQRLGADGAEYDYLRARLRGADDEALRLCLRACRREPSYAEALYLCARLALRLGFRSEGERLLRDIAPLMALSVDRGSYGRDLEAMDGAHLRGASSTPSRRLLRRLQGRSSAMTGPVL